MHVIAAKAVAFKEALDPAFKNYQQQILDNARFFAAGLGKKGFKIISGGTDNHLFLVDLSDQSITGQQAEALLEQAHITLNKNTIPNDPLGPMVSSGLRIGTPAITTRGFKEQEVQCLVDWIAAILRSPLDATLIQRIRTEVLDLCRRFPVYR